MINNIIAIFLGYLLGSIPTAYIAGRICKGIDIRNHGSGNVGATNVFRVLGKWPGIIVLALDIIKGIIPVVIFANIFNISDITMRLLIAIATISGHNWPVFLQFKGGKGVATSLGTLIGLSIVFASFRILVFRVFLVWVFVFLFGKMVSLASIMAGLSLPIFMFFSKFPISAILLGIIFAVFIVLRHKQNLIRIRSGKEPKVDLFKAFNSKR